jgi:hypothetical protein
MTDTLEPQTVSGKLFDLNLSAQQIEISICLNKKFVFYKDCSQVIGAERRVRVDAEGAWETQLLDTDNMPEDAHYVFDIGGRIYKKKVPVNVQGWDFHQMPNV